MAQGHSTGVATRISTGTARCRPERDNGLCAMDFDSVKPCRPSYYIGMDGGEFPKFAMLQLRYVEVLISILISNNGCPDLPLISGAAKH